MTILKKWLCLSLAVLMLASAAVAFTGCAETPDEPVDTQSTDTVNAESDTVEVDDRFLNVNYDGRPFRIYTSTNAASPGMGNSNALIEGSGEVEGNLVNDAVLERNMQVEDLLGVTLEFTQIDVGYDNVASTIRKLTAAGTDEYDLLINDLYPFAELSIEGQFRNALEVECVFDFERSYWYEEYMADLRLMDGYQFLLAGDYFIDIIRSAHILLMNKALYREHYNSDPEAIYDVVTNFEWTYDKMNELITDMYIDKNLDGKVNDGDQFGFMIPETWGGSIAFSISGNPTFISRDEEGVPTVVLHEGDRSNALASAISMIHNNDSTSIDLTADADQLTAFVENEALIMGYQRLGSLENSILRDMEGDAAAVLPYPMLFASDKRYVTSAHDTTEVGAIPATSTDLEFISTVVEVLNRETANIVMPKYYNEGLQVQYVNDSKAAGMIDIIHDNFDNSFALAYNYTLGSVMLQAFSNAASEQREFSAVYQSSIRSVNRAMDEKLRKFRKSNNID